MIDKLHQPTMVNTEQLITSSDELSSSTPDYPLDQQAIDPQSIQDFQQRLHNQPLETNHAILPNQITSADVPVNPMSHLASLEANAMAKLQQLSTSLNPDDYMTTARALSAYQLESMVATKVIAKSTQAIEKLTSLQ